MNSPDSDERIERLKQVLADSYPQRAEGPAREPLPESVRAALRGEAAPATQSQAPATRATMMERLLSWLRAPQLAAIGATAIVVLAAVMLTRPGDGPSPDTPDGPGPIDIRDTGAGAGLPPVVVLHGLGDAQAAVLESSGYFREGQLVRVPDDRELGSFLESMRRPNLVVVDARSGEISAPFAGGDGPEPEPLGEVDGELPGRILDLLGRLPAGTAETPDDER